jgi:hypothetical protein
VRRLTFLFALTALLVAFAPTASAQTTLPVKQDLPVEQGWPIKVQIGVGFADLIAFKESTGIFTATVDVRLRWQDLRLRRPAEEATDPPKIYRGPDAQAQLAKIWVPAAELVNQRSRETYSAIGLRIYPDGTVELTRRVRAEFATAVNVERFPFDRQKLRLDVAIRDQSAEMVALRFDQDDLDFSRAAASVNLDGWDIQSVALRSGPLAGWYGTTHAQVVASLEIARQPAMVAATIFIPLFASLLIPMLSIWLNRLDDGAFQIETFELVNIIIGGLFAVIALNFTVNSAYEALGSGDNPVSRLFALNYTTLGIGLLVNVLLFRFGVVERWFGRYVQEQLYVFLSWAVPVLALTGAGAIILVAVV